MSDTFDTNLLSQIKPLDRKLSISKEFVRDERKQRRDDHGKQSHSVMKQPEKDVHEERRNPPPPDGTDKRKIDIII
jgi:hypothetical protein